MVGMKFMASCLLVDTSFVIFSAVNHTMVSNSTHWPFKPHGVYTAVYGSVTFFIRSIFKRNKIYTAYIPYPWVV